MMRITFSLLIGLVSIIPQAISAAENSLPINIGTHKQLFIDDYLVAGSTGVVFAMNTPTRAHSIVFKADAPWEMKAKAHIGSYCSVLHDEGKIKLWYDVRYGAIGHVAYAESTDGIHFTKPVLGIHSIDGSVENNIVMPGRIGGGAVWIDPHSTPDKRYRSQSKGYNEPTDEQLYAYYSSDGLHWTLWQTQDIGDCDTQSIAFWDTRVNRYVMYTRRNPGAGTEGRYRVVRRLESDTLEHWEKEVVVMQADDVDNASYAMQSRKPPVDYYGGDVFLYPDANGVYLMLSQAFWHFNKLEPEIRPEIDQPRLVKNGRYAPSTFDVRLAVSRDGIHFQRLGNRKPFLTPGLEGAFDARMVWAIPNPVQMGEELWVYYVGGNTDHDGFVDPKADAAQSGVGLATLRLDGFVSADAPYTGGELLTKALIFQGNHLELNIDTGGGGSALVEVLDAHGQVISEYSREKATLLYGNSTHMPVTWGNNQDVSPLAGKRVQLRFIMRDCKLYAFQFCP